MNDIRLTLRQIAERASDRHDGARGRALDRVAKDLGLTLSYTTVDKILEGKYRSTPKATTLDALSELSGVPKDQVYAAAGMPMPQAPLAEQLPPDADLLTPMQRDAVIAVVRQFAQANKALFAANQEELMGNAEHPAPTKLPVPQSAERMKIAARGAGRRGSDDLAEDAIKAELERRRSEGDAAHENSGDDEGTA